MSSIENIAEYKNNYQYFHVHLALIAYGFSIDELKNIFNTTLPQFLKDNEEYNQKITYKTFKDKYN